MNKVNISLLSLFVLLFSVSFSQSELSNIDKSSAYISYWTKNLDTLSNQWIMTKQTFYPSFNSKNPKSISSEVLLDFYKSKPQEFIINHPRTLAILQSYLLNSSKTEMAMSYFNSYSAFFEQKLIEKGLPKELKYIPFALTAMNNKAINENGAGGIWQIMYSSGLKQGLEINSYVDERRNIEKATEAALNELVEINKLYSDLRLTLLAYTCGPTNVSKAIRRSDFSRDFNQIFDKLPTPGNDILFALTASIILFENNQKLGLTIPNGNYKIDIDSVEINKRLHFTQLSSILSISIDELRYINPDYKLDILPVVTEKYLLKLPKGSLSKFANFKDSIFTFQDSILFNMQTSNPVNHPQIKETGINNINQKSDVKVTYYKVRKGDKIFKIAKANNVSEEELLKWNNLRSVKALKVGSRIKIIKEINPAPTVKQDTIEGNKSKPQESKTDVKNKNKDTKDTNPKTIYHTVKSGENLSTIAKKYKNVSVADILKWNNMSNPDKLSLGQKLKILNQ